MVATWVADIRPLYEKAIYKMYYKQVPEFRRTKADKICTQEKKAQSIGAWVLYEHARKMGELPKEAVFNLSHSGDFALCSVTDQTDAKLGCDIEIIKAYKQKIAKRFFCEREYAYIEEQATMELRGDAFYRYWVLKESVMKATRLGMALDMRAFEIRIDNNENPVFCVNPPEMTAPLFFREYENEIEGVKIAVCSSDNNFDNSLKRLFIS